MISEIGKELFMVRSTEKDFHRNIYFKRFIGNGNQVNMIFDPGTKLDGDLVMEASDKLFGGLQNIHIIFLSHQDPDVSALTPFIMAGAKKSILITSIDTFRLVNMYGIPQKRTLMVENYNSEILTLKNTGHQVRFVPAYYCHFRGAMMFFDYETNILVSGDFGAGINTKKGRGIFADDSSWDGIRTFHTIYMPSSDAVKETVNRIGLLNPLPEIIAPQHGDLIGKDVMVDFLSRLNQLEVGVDYQKSQAPQKDILMTALTAFISRTKNTHPAEWEKIQTVLNEPGQFTTVFNFSNEAVADIKVEYTDALRHLIAVIESAGDPAVTDGIKTNLHLELEKHHLMLPSSIMAKLKLGDDESVPDLDDILN